MLFAIGLLLPLAVVFLYFIHVAGWEKFYYDVFQYNIEYSRYFTHWMSLIKNTWIIFGKTLIFWIIMASYFSLIIHKRKLEKQPFNKQNSYLSEINFSLICLSASLIILIISKGRHLYYFLEIIPFLIISSLLMLKSYLQEINYNYSFKKHYLIKYPLIVIAIVISSYSIDFNSFVHENFTAINYFQKNGYTYKNYPDVKVAEKIKNLLSDSQSDNTLFVAGSRGDIYPFSECDAPYYGFIPNVSDKISLKPNYITNEIKRFNPTYIVEWNYKMYFPDSTRLRKYIEKNYTLNSEFSRLNNYPYQSKRNARLYVRKKND